MKNTIPQYFASTRHNTNRMMYQDYDDDTGNNNFFHQRQESNTMPGTVITMNHSKRKGQQQKNNDEGMYPQSILFTHKNNNRQSQNKTIGIMKDIPERMFQDNDDYQYKNRNNYNYHDKNQHNGNEFEDYKSITTNWSELPLVPDDNLQIIEKENIVDNHKHRDTKGKYLKSPIPILKIQPKTKKNKKKVTIVENKHQQLQHEQKKNQLEKNSNRDFFVKALSPGWEEEYSSSLLRISNHYQENIPKSQLNIQKYNHLSKEKVSSNTSKKGRNYDAVPVSSLFSPIQNIEYVKKKEKNDIFTDNKDVWNVGHGRRNNDNEELENGIGTSRKMRLTKRALTRGGQRVIEEGGLNHNWDYPWRQQPISNLNHGQSKHQLNHSETKAVTTAHKNVKQFHQETSEKMRDVSFDIQSDMINESWSLSPIKVDGSFEYQGRQRHHGRIQPEHQNDVKMDENEFMRTVAAIVIQTFFRRHLAYRLTLERYSAVITIQRFLRCIIEERKAASIYHFAAVQIQTLWRGWWARDCFAVDRYCATVIQRNVRLFLQKCRLDRRVFAAACMIQKNWRGRHARKNFLKERKRQALLRASSRTASSYPNLKSRSSSRQDENESASKHLYGSRKQHDSVYYSPPAEMMSNMVQMNRPEIVERNTSRESHRTAITTKRSNTTSTKSTISRPSNVERHPSQGSQSSQRKLTLYEDDILTKWRAMRERNRKNALVEI